MPTYRVVYKILSESTVTSNVDAVSMSDALNKLYAQEDVVIDKSDETILKYSMVSINEQPDFAVHADIEQGVK